jgi:hypothetical protein
LVQENPKAFESFEKFQALIAAGRLEEIDQLLRPQNARAFDPFHVLLVGLAWEAAGHPERAAPWLQEALNQLRSERPEYAVAAEYAHSSRANRLNGRVGFGDRAAFQSSSSRRPPRAIILSKPSPCAKPRASSTCAASFRITRSIS